MGNSKNDSLNKVFHGMKLPIFNRNHSFKIHSDMLTKQYHFFFCIYPQLKMFTLKSKIKSSLDQKMFHFESLA